MVFRRRPGQPDVEQWGIGEGSFTGVEQGGCADHGERARVQPATHDLVEVVGVPSGNACHVTCDVATPDRECLASL